MLPDHAGCPVAIYCLFGATGRELSCRLALPLRALTPNLGNLGRTVARSERPKGRTGFDRLKLLWIANHDDLCSSGLGVSHDPLHLPRTNESSLVNYQYIARG